MPAAASRAKTGRGKTGHCDGGSGETRHLIPRRMTWCSVRGVSNRACRGTPRRTCVAHRDGAYRRCGTESDRSPTLRTPESEFSD